MLSLKIFIGVLILGGLFRCKTGLECFRYIPQADQKNILECKWTEGEAVQFLNFVCHAQKKDENKPLSFQFEYKGQRKDLEKIKSVEVRMYEVQNGKGLQEIPFAKNYVRFDNADTYYLNMPMGKENYTGNWHELVYKRQDYSDQRIHYFYLYQIWEEKFTFKNMPNEVKLEIRVESVEGKKEWTLFLRKIEMDCGKKVRTNPFG